MQNGAVYWVGSDNNIYLKGAPGVTGVANLGQAPPTTGIDNSPTNGYGITNSQINLPGANYQANRIADPNPGGGQVLGASSYNTSGTSGSSAGSNSPAAYASVFQPLYDSEVGGLQNQINAIPSYQNAESAQVQNTFNPQASTLEHQHAEGQANLALAQNQLDTQRSVGLRNIGNNLRTALNGYQNQIGVMGAGNSSAAPLIGYALSQQGNRQMSDVNTGYNQQQTGLNTQGSDLETNFNDQKNALDAWKQQSLSQIAEKYAQQQAALQQQIAQTRGEEARYLALYGSTALAQQAVSQLQALQGQYSDQIGQLNSHFQQVAAPNADISKYTQANQISPFDVSSLNQLSFGANQDNSSAPTATASLTKRPDQTPNIGF